MPRRKPAHALSRFWTNYTKTRNWLLGAGSSLLVLTGVWAWAAPYAEAVTPVTHSYMRAVITPRIILAQIDANKERRERLMRENKDRELELQSPGAQGLPKYKQDLQDGIKRNSDELKTLEEKDKSLFKEQEELKK